MEELHKRHLISSSLHLLQLLTLLLSLSLEASIFFFFSQTTTTTSLHLLPVVFLLLLLFLPVLKQLHAHYYMHDVYLLDYSCLLPPPSFRVPVAGFFEHISLLDCFDDKSVDFMSKVIASAGMGDETCLPPSLHYLPPITDHHACLEEARLLMFPTIDNLFAKTKVKPHDVDLVVVNCSGFCPAPSLSAMVVNHYGFRDDVKSFNISGMGCGAGAIAVDVARGAMRSGSARCALLVSTEVVSTGWYSGKDRRKLLLNCFFRMGCSAVLLTNRREGKYKLVRLLRTNRAFDDRGYRSGYRTEDEDGITGFSVERDWFDVAPEVLRANVVALGKTILPVSEKLRYLVLSVRRAAAGRSKGGQVAAVDWRKVIQHFCLPASGRVVIEKIGRGLGLGDEEMEAARMTFHRFGNQSSSSMWYQLAYVEAEGRVGEGDEDPSEDFLNDENEQENGDGAGLEWQNDAGELDLNSR